MEPVRHVQRDREIKTVIVDNYFPYSFVNDKGEPDGFSVDLIKAVAKELGIHIEIRVEVWDNALKKLSNDKINVLPMMAYSEKRDKKFDFSPPHTVAYDAYFTRKDSPKIENPNDLQGKKIIVMKNDRAHDYLKSIPFINEEQLIYENSTAEAMRNLASGIGDTAVMPKVLGLVLVNKLKIEKVDTSPEVVQNYQRAFSFAVKEGNSGFLARLENGLQIIKEMGEYKKIHEKWLGVYETHEVSFGYEGKVAESRGEGVADIPPGRRETILLVEDDLQILKLARQILDALGYTVLTAGTPDEAIDLAKKHTGEIHLLITDVIMPEMNGRELSEQIQPLYPNLKRMFMSGYTANVIAHHGVLDEGMHFIQKPFSKSDLATTVRKVLDEAKS